MFLLFTPVVIGFGYVVSWVFSDVQTAQEWFGEIINFSMAIPFLITTFVILDTTELGHSLCGIVPGYAIYRGFGIIEAEAKAGQPYAVQSRGARDTSRAPPIARSAPFLHAPR